MADILIRGMKMPLRCINCPFKTYYHSENRCLANRGKPIEYVIGNDRGTNCPLLPIPEGHGRLIDADALDRAFTDLRFNSDGTLNHWGDRPGWCMHGYEVEKLIADAPTIVPVEGGTEDG